MTRRNLPIGIQTFRKIRESDYYYVDKTGFALRLIAEGSALFPVAPATLRQVAVSRYAGGAVRGQRAAVPGPGDPPGWDWSSTYPVIRISFAEGVLHSRARAGSAIDDLLRINASATWRRGRASESVAARFGELIRQAHAHYGQRVVVLVDEYDKPILDNLTDPDTPGRCATGCAISTR